MDFDEVLSKLFRYYNVSSITDFANVIGAERSTVNGWKSRKALGTMLDYINSNDQKAMEYIYSPSNTQTIQTVSGGQVAQTVNGDMVGRDKVDGIAHNKPNTNPQEMNTQQDAGVDVAQNICKDIDPATLNLFIESYQKAKDKDDIKGFRVYLMDY